MVPALYLLRHARRWSQEDLGERAGGLTRETVSRIERGVEKPRPATQARLAAALGQPVGVVFPPEKEG